MTATSQRAGHDRGVPERSAPGPRGRRRWSTAPARPWRDGGARSRCAGAGRPPSRRSATGATRRSASWPPEHPHTDQEGAGHGRAGGPAGAPVRPAVARSVRRRRRPAGAGAGERRRRDLALRARRDGPVPAGPGRARSCREQSASRRSLDAAYCATLLFAAWAAQLDWYVAVGWLDLGGARGGHRADRRGGAARADGVGRRRPERSARPGRRLRDRCRRCAGGAVGAGGVGRERAPRPPDPGRLPGHRDRPRGRAAGQRRRGGRAGETP